MEIIKDQISKTKLKQLSQNKFGNFIKAVVDIEQGIMSIDAELHADEEQQLLQNGSKQEDLWGVNIYPDENKDNWIEFDSMINLRPAQGNLTRGISDPTIQNKIITIVEKLVQA